MDFYSLSRKQKILLLSLILVVLAIPLTLYLSQKTQIFKPRAEESGYIKALTKDLLQAKKDSEGQNIPERVGIQSADVDSNRLKSIAIIRKNALIREAQDNPQAFLNDATLTDQVATFPIDIQPLLEYRVEVAGELLVFHGDNIDERKSKTFYKIQDHNKLFDLTFANNPPEGETGSQVEIKGVGIDTSIVSVDGAPPQTIFRPAPLFVESTTGVQRTVVLMANFEGNSEEPVSVEQIKEMMFPYSSNSVNGYYRENSFNKTWFSGDVFGWFTILKATECNFYQFGLNVDQVAKASGIDLANYNRIVYILPSALCQPFVGYGNIGGNPSRSWIFNPLQKELFMHELGHNLGLAHANSITCSQPKFAQSNPIIIHTQGGESLNCGESEYGDPYDIMGSAHYQQNSYHFNALHKTALGWTLPSQVQIASSGTYRIIASEIPFGAQVLKIFKPNTLEYYFVSFRKATGLDSSLPESATKGVSIHRWNGNPATTTKLIDATEQTGEGIFDQTLSDGESFIDQDSGIEIKQLSHDQTSVTVEVKNAPTLPLGKIQGRYIDINDQPFTNTNQISLSSKILGYKGSSITTPDWFFDNLIPGAYTMTVNPVPGFSVYHSFCRNCTTQGSYNPGNSLDLDILPTGGFIDVSFKYIPEGISLPRPSSAFPVD